MHNCDICNKEIELHTLEEAQLCYYKSKLPYKNEEVN